MDKSEIVSEIKRTADANGGIPLGSNRFATETGIKENDWFGIHWVRWGDALVEAGFQPNQLKEAFDKEHLLQKYAELARELGHLPVKGELAMKRKSDSTFPSVGPFKRIGNKSQLVRMVAEFCHAKSEYAEVEIWCNEYLDSKPTEKANADSNSQPPSGFVYLLKHGSRTEYKIGRTNNRLRREGEIALELPEEVKPIHVIETDDPAGIENYWHRRFGDKRLKNEWFKLNASDVRAFKRWRRIF